MLTAQECHDCGFIITDERCCKNRKPPQANGICAPSAQPELAQKPRNPHVAAVMQRVIVKLLHSLSPQAFFVLIHDAQSMQAFLTKHEARIKLRTRLLLKAQGKSDDSKRTDPAV